MVLLHILIIIMKYHINEIYIIHTLAPQSIITSSSIIFNIVFSAVTSDTS